MRRARILLVDDEMDLIEPFAEYLRDLGYDVGLAASAAECDREIERHGASLVVLDLNMPGESGLDLLGRLSARGDLAILVLTASREFVDRIAGLEMGADDFVTKPIDPQELAARIGGILQRRGSGHRNLLRLEEVTVDLSASRLLRPGHPPERLGAGEVVLLATFARNPDRILTRDDLMEQAPAESLDANDRAIDTRVARLRRKLATDSIVTVRGHGYMFVPPFRHGP